MHSEKLGKSSFNADFFLNYDFSEAGAYIYNTQEGPGGRPSHSIQDL